MLEIDRRTLIKGAIGAMGLATMGHLVGEARGLSEIVLHPALPRGKGVAVGWNNSSELDLQRTGSGWYSNYSQVPIYQSHLPFIRVVDPSADPFNVGSSDIVSFSNEPNDPNQNPQSPQAYVADHIRKARLIRQYVDPALATAGIADSSVWFADQVFNELHRQGAYQEGVGPNAWIIHVWNHIYDRRIDPYDSEAFRDRIRQFIYWMDRNWIKEPLILGEWGVAREPSVPANHYSEAKDARFMEETLRILQTDQTIKDRLIAYEWFPLKGDYYAPLMRGDGTNTLCGDIYQST